MRIDDKYAGELGYLLCGLEWIVGLEVHQKGDGVNVDGR
jgi:hypothetical protein